MEFAETTPLLLLLVLCPSGARTSNIGPGRVDDSHHLISAVRESLENRSSLPSKELEFF